MSEDVMKTVLAGVTGSLVTLVVKYFFDWFLESQKIKLGQAAKRRERYYEKQSVVLSGAYERLARCLMPTSRLYMKLETTPNALMESIKEATEEADLADKAFRQYFNENIIYFPPAIADRFEDLSQRLRTIIEGDKLFPADKYPTNSPSSIEAYRNHEEMTAQLLMELQEEFRRFMVDGEVKQAGDRD